MEKDFRKLPYRNNVCALIIKDSKFLVVQNKSYKENEWKFLSGGINKNETEEKALLRELKEELRTKNFHILFKSKYKNVHDWPIELIKKRYSRFRGQKQTIFFVNFLGKYSEIKINKEELKNYKWIEKDQLRNYLIFPNQYKIFNKVINEYNDFVKENLPYRKNCEGYLLDGKGNVIARDTGKGYIEFPGGGVNENETPEQALIREAYEETGVIIEGKLKRLGMLRIKWGKNWAKTKKQKERYKKFKGEEMHFFTGKIEMIDSKLKSRDSWKGENLMTIKNVIKSIERNKPFPRNMEEYYNFQSETLGSLLK